MLKSCHSTPIHVRESELHRWQRFTIWRLHGIKLVLTITITVKSKKQLLLKLSKRAATARHCTLRKPDLVQSTGFIVYRLHFTILITKYITLICINQM